MVKQSPRIYVYKITFEEIRHYYYGVHKEKKFGEYYMGSPVTHKDFWELYTPKKEYIEFFEYSDEGYAKARIFESSLIAPVLNDEFCLNEHCGGSYSLETCRNAGKIGGKRTYERGIGIHGRSKEKMSEDNRKSGLKSYKLKVGVHARSKEQMTEDGKKAAQKNKENGTAIFSMTSEERSKAGKKGGKTTFERGVGVYGLSKEQLSKNGKKNGPKGGKACYEKGVGAHGRSKEQMTEDGKKGGKAAHEKGLGVHALSKEELSEAGKKGGKIGGNKNKENKTGICGLSPEEKSEAGKKGGKVTNSQKWQCTQTGYVSTAGGLSCYQKAKGIDTSKRIKVDGPRELEITFEDGRVVVTTQTLKEWAEENGYSYDGVLKVRGGRSRNHKGIIKVVPS